MDAYECNTETTVNVHRTCSVSCFAALIHLLRIHISQFQSFICVFVCVYIDIDIHFDDSFLIFWNRQWFRLFAVLHKSPTPNVGMNVMSQQAVPSCH